MDDLKDAIAQVRKELDTNEIIDAQPSEGSYATQNVSAQKRRLLDIAWKMYDITAEMFYLKSDVATLASKVESLEASAGVDDTTLGRGTVSESHADYIASGEVKRLHPFGQLRQENTPIQATCKKKNLLGMDDLSFSIFKEIVSEIAAECVGKIKATDKEEEKERLRDFREIRKTKLEDLGRDRRDVGGYKSLYDWKYSRKGDKYLKKDTKHKPSIYGRERLEDLRYTLNYRSPGLDTRLADITVQHSNGVATEERPVAMKKKQVSFRRHSSNTDDWPVAESGLLGKLNDSLYFHRSHLSPADKSQYKSKRESDPIRMSPTFSSDGSDFL